MSTFARALVAAWALFWSFVLFLVLLPKLATRVPHLRFIRPYMVTLFIATLAYVVLWLYRQGMMRAKRNPLDGGSRHYDARR